MYCRSAFSEENMSSFFGDLFGFSDGSGDDSFSHKGRTKRAKNSNRKNKNEEGSFFGSLMDNFIYGATTKRQSKFSGAVWVRSSCDCI